jgi:hypothetical protein
MLIKLILLCLINKNNNSIPNLELRLENVTITLGFICFIGRHSPVMLLNWLNILVHSKTVASGSFSFFLGDSIINIPHPIILKN